MNSDLPVQLVAICGAVAGVVADLRRRRLSVRKLAGWSVLTALDVAAIAAIFSLGPALLLRSGLRLASGNLTFWSPLAWGLLAGSAAGIFLWQEGRRQVQFQRPAGLVAGEWLVLFGVFHLSLPLLFQHHNFWFSGAHPAAWTSFSGALLMVGAVLIVAIVPPFVKGQEEHRVLERIAAQGQFVQSEWIPPTPECPHPESWQMLDPQSAEVEVLDFLKILVTTVKPNLIVETGTFIGHSAIKMAEGLRANGFGKIITIEHDPSIFSKARQQIEDSGLRNWIECRNASSLETQIDGPIDIFYSDSLVTIREQEVRRFLPQIRPNGLILIHDASSHFKVVREAALRLEREGLLSVVLLSSPRGLCLAQKREGRK